MNRVREDIQSLFHDHTAEEGDDHLIVTNAVRAAPLHVAPLGVELIAIDPARPDGDVAVHALRTENSPGRFGGRQNNFTAMIEAAHDAPRERFERLKMIISEIGIEPRMHRRHCRDLVPASPADRAMTDKVRARDVDDVRIEPFEVAAHPQWNGNGQAIFRAAGDRDRRHVNQIARGLERGLFHRRRIDADLNALAEQILDKAIQRLIGAIPHVIVVAREEGDAEVTGLHGAGL
jgi:hypothetical protein